MASGTRSERRAPPTDTEEGEEREPPPEWGERET